MQPFNPDDAINVVDANNQFAFDLYARLAQKPGNKFFSPNSVSNALAMTCAGAKGQSADEMAKTLHFTLEGVRLHSALGKVIRQLQGKDRPGMGPGPVTGTGMEPGPVTGTPFKLTTVNQLWAQNGLTIRPEFLRIAQTDYQSGLQLVDFKKDPDGSRKTINRWVQQQTNDKIKDLVQPDTIKPLTRLVLTNASYFKGDWLLPFNPGATRPNDFTIPGKPAFKVPMMRQQMRVPYQVTDDFQLVRLLYNGEQFSMVVILPKKMDGLAEVEKKLSAKWLRETLRQTPNRLPGNTKWRQVLVSMPKFKMTEEFELKDELVAMGMRTAFSDQADFSALADTSLDKLKIDAVIHKAFVDVNETGTDVAIIGGGAVILPEAREQDPPIFRADHPFLFVIQHEATGSILFLGRVCEPDHAGDPVGEGGPQGLTMPVPLPDKENDIGRNGPPPGPGGAGPVTAGAMILQVQPGSPATRVINVNDRKTSTLEAGDVITHVNDVQIKSERQYYSALAAPGRITLQVVDGKTGQTRTVEATPQGGLLGIRFRVNSAP